MPWRQTKTALFSEGGFLLSLLKRKMNMHPFSFPPGFNPVYQPTAFLGEWSFPTVPANLQTV